MTYRAVAVADGALFDEIIEFKSIMEQFDEQLKSVQFIHKDRLYEAKASGDFISAPLAFVLSPVCDEKEYKKALEEAQQIKAEFNISNCLLMFTAPAEAVFAEKINETNFIDYKIYSLVRSIHILHESYAPEEDAVFKLLALISGLLQSCQDENNIAFDRDYITATLECNYDNFNASAILSLENIKNAVENINSEICELNEDIQQLQQKKSRKYQCLFSSRQYSVNLPDADAVPSKSEDLLAFCKRYASLTSDAFEQFAGSTEADVITAQHALTSAFSSLETNDEVNTASVIVSDFAEGETPAESSHLIKRCNNIRLPARHKLSELIPLLRAVKNSDGVSLKNGWKMVIPVMLIIIAAICAYVIPFAIKSGTASFTNNYIGVLCGFAGMVIVALIIALLLELLQKNRLKNYLRNIVNENKQFFSAISSLTADMRNYIDKFVTVSVNSFIKTKKIDIARAKIEELKKQKKEYGLKADTIRKRENIFDGFCKENLAEIALLHDFNELDKFVRNNSVTEEHSNACCPRITESRWLRSVAFEIAVK